MIFANLLKLTFGGQQKSFQQDLYHATDAISQRVPQHCSVQQLNSGFDLTPVRVLV